MRLTFLAPPDLLPRLGVPRFPQQQRSRAKWERVLAAAQAVFDDQGYSRATVDAICLRAGVSTGTFYSYLRDKRQLLFVLLGEYLDVLADELSQVDLSRHPLVSIQRLVAVMLGTGEDAAGYRGTWRAWKEATIQDAELAVYDQKVTGWLAATVVEAMDQVGLDEYLRPDLDRVATARLIVTLLLDSFPGEAAGKVPEAVIAATTRMIYHALFADPPNLHEAR